MTIVAIAIATKMVTCKKKKKKLWKEGGKNMRQKGKRGAVKKKEEEKKSGGGPPDLSGAGSRDGCPRLKVLQVPRKKKECPHECL